MRYKGLTAVSAVAIACVAQAASAQARNFDVPAQPAVTAIPTFARQAGVQIVAPAARLKGRMAQAVKGQMDVDAALTQLLAGTGLSVAARTGQTISLRVADEAPAETSDASPDNSEAGSAADNSIIVTGRAGTGGRTKAQTSYAVSTLSADFLRTRAPSSVTEALKSVPGFWVEASGGEASGNIRARGIPVDGFGSINLLEDGLPVQHDPALGYLNADQTFRVDESIDRVEVVRGGPSSIFASNAPGGSVNFIMRKPGDEFSGLAKYEYGPTANLNRFDAWFGGPIGDGWKFDVGGFYRNEDGVRDPGFTGNRGGQIRADLSKDFSRGHVSLSFKRLDDHTILYTGIPLTKDANGDIVAVNGFDGHYGTLASPETAHLTLRDAHGGVVNYDNTDGTRVKLNQYSAMADYEIFDGWTLSNKARFRTSDTVRNGIYPSALSKASDYVNSVKASLLAAYPGASSVLLRYTDTGQAFDLANQNGNGLIIQNSARPVTVSENEFVDDLRLTHEFAMGSTKHNIAIGGYFAHIKEHFGRYSAATLQDVSDNSRLLDLVALNAAGQVVGSLTQNGVTRYSSEFANGSGTSDTFALYASDEWQITHQLRVDGGLRFEHVNPTGAAEGSTTVNLGDPTTLADNTALVGNGVFSRFNRHFQHLGWTLGVDYQFTPRMGVFARYTSAFRLPGVGDFITNATATPVVQKIKLSEGGFKLSSDKVNLYVTGFNTDYSSYAIGNYVFNPITGIITQSTQYADTRTYGVEVETVLRPVHWFDLALEGTVQQPKFRNLKYTELVNGALLARDYDGHQLLRVPKISLRATPEVNLLDDRLHAQVDIEHYGSRYADAANTQKLPSYTVINASVRYALTPKITLYAYGDNLNNSLGLTEGNPRAGELTSGQASDQFFIGRPILGRSFRFAAMYQF